MSPVQAFPPELVGLTLLRVLLQELSSVRGEGICFKSSCVPVTPGTGESAKPAYAVSRLALSLVERLMLRRVHRT